MDGSISIEGLDQVLKGLKGADRSVIEAAMTGIQRAGLNIIADAQENLRRNQPPSIVTGLLRQSGRVQKTDDNNVDIGFFDTQNKEGGYAFYVEYGRRAGRMPPPDVLAAYAYKKLQLKDWNAARAIGWGMAVRIAEKGTKPHPFFNPAVEKNKKSIVNAVQDAINKATR